MIHPSKWRETVDPFSLPYKNFKLIKVLGYPHAGNDVFHAEGIYQDKTVEVYIKVARQLGADIQNEVRVITQLNLSLAPKIIDFDFGNTPFVVMIAKCGERLSVILGDNSNTSSREYLFEYGETLAKLHSIKGKFEEVKDRRFFHVRQASFFEDNNLLFVYDYLMKNKPKTVNKCFCHGDFHYANVLWSGKSISAILDFELAGIGNREFDIAWASIRRPGQTFLVKKEEVELFLKGYSSVETYNEEYVKYYMVLIYSYFYEIGIKNEEYVTYVREVFNVLCKC